MLSITEKFINFSIIIKSEGATMKSMSSSEVEEGIR